MNRNFQDFCKETGRDCRWYTNIDLFEEFADWKYASPAQNKLPVYDVVSGVTLPRNTYVALLCAKKIQELSRASETMVCPSIEIIKRSIEENLVQFFGS